MENLWPTTQQAFSLLFSGDGELWSIIAISFGVSIRAIIYAAPLALLVSFLLSLYKFPLKRPIVVILNTLVSVPAVVVGLTLYILLSRHGPMGEWRLLFSQQAMIMGQFLLAFPILTVMSYSALQQLDKKAWETTRTLGLGITQSVMVIVHECRFALIAALIAGFGRIISEVGASMMLGGNILNLTRNIPTAIALETSKGEFAQGIALGIVLLFMALVLNYSLHYFQGRGEMRL